MPVTSKPSQGRHVKGSLIVDYVKMIRGNPQLPWADHLKPEDLALINQLILPSSWYPMEVFQRIGMATFKLVAQENYTVIRAYGRALADRINQENPGMVVKGRARNTLRKYREIQNRMYSFKPVETEDLAPQRLLIHIFSAPTEPEAKLLMEIISGTLERLIELSGGRDIKIKLLEAVWKGADQNTLEVTWEESHSPHSNREVPEGQSQRN